MEEIVLNPQQALCVHVHFVLKDLPTRKSSQIVVLNYKQVYLTANARRKNSACFNKCYSSQPEIRTFLHFLQLFLPDASSVYVNSENEQVKLIFVQEQKVFKCTETSMKGKKPMW